MKVRTWHPVVDRFYDDTFRAELAARMDEIEARGDMAVVDGTHFRVFRKPKGQRRIFVNGQANGQDSTSGSTPD